jgi:hypothetical protein
MTLIRVFITCGVTMTGGRRMPTRRRRRVKAPKASSLQLARFE